MLKQRLGGRQDRTRYALIDGRAPCTCHLEERLAAHSAGRGARLLQVVHNAGITWRLARRVGGPLAALIAVALLVTCPLYYGNMFINAKDSPFAVAMVFLTLALVRPVAATAAVLAAVSCILGVLIERWLFFAEAKHTVTLYYGQSTA